MNKILTYILSLILLSVVTVGYAHETGQPHIEFKQDRLEELRVKKEELRKRLETQKKAKVGERCEMVEKRIDEKISRYEEKKTAHFNNYNNVVERLEKLISKLKEDDIDTSKLEDVKKGLEPLIEEFDKDYAAFIEALRESRKYTCGASEGVFKDKVLDAHVLLKEVQEDAKEIREYYRDNVKPVLMEIRKQKDRD